MIKKKTIFRLAKIVVPLVLGLFFIYLTYRDTSVEERQTIVSYLKQTPEWVVLLSILIGLCSHVSRSIRWRYMLIPMGYKTNPINNFLSIMVAYLANLGIPRSGEVLRATTIATYEKVPFPIAIGNIVAERIIDLLMLGIFILIALVLNVEVIGQLLVENFKSWIISTLIISIVILFLYQLTRYLKKKIKTKKANQIRNFYNQFIQGVQILLQMRNKLYYILHSVFIWIMYFLMFYVVKFAMHDTYNMSLDILLPGFIIGVLTIATTNGGLGLYPLAVGTYFISFGISRESSFAFGWIVWTIQTVLIVVFGGLSFGILPLVNKSLTSKSN